ncbi:BTAD domain-containing putative transcriptional regulator [Litchfieldia alkalitelluris]|uniref:BTAD domain-containing putative transcriptional regulator n=1 Tax=Litchfieldia alkalitelluris TaxID=304268 RepID=UPI000996C02B|nr:BTAD domain-containing putative transcriptional regulator [Litchfieldia alkalitelluris]
MSDHLSIVKTKISPPDVKENVVRRRLISKKMKAVTEYPLSIIHSGPGYGKTTAMASYIHDSEAPFCWYSVDVTDDEIIPFLTYMIYSVRSQHDSFGAEILSYLSTMERFIRAEEIRTLCSLFINSVVEIAEDITLIIDDYHFVQNSRIIDEWLQYFIQHIPENLHFVIISRNKPTWDFLLSYKVKGSLLEIMQEDLQFTPEEIEVLISETYGYEVTQEDLQSIYHLTEGWVIAIGMITGQLVSDGNISNIVKNESQSLDELFGFLALEVFLKQPIIIQQFLENTCIFKELSGTLCDEVLGIRGSSEILKDLSTKNVFLLSLGNGRYRYHALFRDFLIDRLVSTNEKQYNDLNLRSSDYFKSLNDYSLAIYHLETIGEYKRLAAILHHYGPTMIENGQLESLLEKISKIPDDLKDFYYKLWIYYGEIMRYRCTYTQAERCYQKAYERARQADDPIGESQALEGQARIYLDTIQPGKAERILQHAINVLEKTKESSEIDKSRLYNLMAENLVNAGQAKKAYRWYEKGKYLSGVKLDGNLEARLYLRTGRLVEARKILMQNKLNEQKHSSTVHLQQSHRETVLLLSLIESFMGNGYIAKELADEGIKQGLKYKAPFVEACGWIRMGHAVQLIDKYDLMLAKQCYETALEIMDTINVSRGKAEPLMGICLLLANRDAYEQAIEYGEKALLETEKVKDAWLSALILLGMGRASVYNKQPIKAEEYLRKCITLFSECGDQFGLLMSELWLAFLYYEEKKSVEFIEAITSFLKNLQVGEYEFILSRKSTFGPLDPKNIVPLLLAAQKEGIQKQYITQLLYELGVLNITQHPGYTLKIQTLGKFQVWIGQKRIEETDWQRGKAKELLQLFITRRHSLILKTEIHSLLWPEHDEKAATRDFKVALNALNNALEPHRQARGTPFFIQRVGSAYGLNPDAGYALDIIQFENWIQSGLEEKETDKVILCLERGLELYEGDLLPEKRYEDWCLNERERLQVLFLRGAEKLAQCYVQVQQYQKAMNWCEQILIRDKTWEEAYRLLMYCYYQSNNRPQAMKWYRKCCDILEKELGVEPMEPTKQMFEMIVGLNVY